MPNISIKTIIKHLGISSGLTAVFCLGILGTMLKWGCNSVDTHIELIAVHADTVNHAPIMATMDTIRKDQKIDREHLDSMLAVIVSILNVTTSHDDLIKAKIARNEGLYK
jgi:hypothetical protein